MENEDSMWKGFYNRLQRKFSAASITTDPKVEQIDGGFFERYGSSLKKNIVEENLDSEIDKHDILSEKELEQVNDYFSNMSQLSLTELLSLLMELNLNELYEEVLHEIMHCVGVEKNSVNLANLTIFAQEAFKIEQEVHEVIYKTVLEKAAPSLMLNIEVIEGTDIKPKDANGLSDPFCVLYLQSSLQHKHSTSIKSLTLQPVWEEYFSLPITSNINDTLCVEMWDFDPVEKIEKKIGKIGDIKGIKGLKKYVKEFSTTATNGKYTNELIGVVEIPIQTIPARGKTAWYELKKKDKVKSQGNLSLKLSYGSGRCKEFSVQEHKHLLRVLLIHQITEQTYEINSWMGEFLPESSLIIQQHAVQNNISPVDESLCQWIEFINVHVQSSVINFKVFLDILKTLIKPISTGNLSSEELKIFWQSVGKILPFCYNFIRTIRKKCAEDKEFLLQIEYVLNIFKCLLLFDIPNDIELFPPDVYSWLLPCEYTRDIKITLKDTIIHGAIEWYVHILDHNKPYDFTEEGQIKFQLKIVQHLKSDLQRAMEFHNKLFIKQIEFPYASVLFSIYGCKIFEMCEPFVTRICRNMKPIDTEENSQLEIANDPFSTGTSLFELYMGIKKFADLGKTDDNVDFDKSFLAKFHVWFQQGVERLLDIAAHKAMQRIERAVELDKLVNVDSIVEYSSSAVDTLSIFYQIKVFWQQLAWPDVESSYTFVTKIIDDICKCSVYYTDKMAFKVNNVVTKKKRFEVTKEWCLAVNNIDYIKLSILPFINDLGLKQLTENLSNSKREILTDDRENAFDLVVKNAIDNVNNKIIDLLQTVVNKMSPEIEAFLIEGGKVLNTNHNKKHVDKLIQYLDENLCMLSDKLNDENFQMILGIIIENLAALMHKIIQQNLEKPPLYFRNLRDSFHMLFGFLRSGSEIKKSETIQKLEALLYLYTLDTVDLIQEYYLERLQRQNEMQEATEGVLSVKLLLVNNTLKVDILNAYNIKSMDSNGLSDCFVKVQLLPKEKFRNITKPVTAVQKKTLCPLFDEHFEILLTPEQCATENVIIMFILKDEDLMGIKNELISHAFVNFKDIPTTSNDLENTPQIRLNLTSPISLDSKALNALKNRTKDKLASNFLKKEKSKMSECNIKRKKSILFG